MGFDFYIFRHLAIPHLSSSLYLSAAQNLLEVKRMFVRYVSHEIRTPLSAVVLGLNYLKKQSESNNSTMDEDTIDVVEEVRMSCEAAVDILNDLLTYEKLDGGLLETYFKREPAFEFVRNATKPFKLQVLFHCHFCALNILVLQYVHTIHIYIHFCAYNILDII